MTYSGEGGISRGSEGSDKAILCELANQEIRARSLRSEFIELDLMDGLPWTILLTIMIGDLNDEEKTLQTIAAIEHVPIGLALRWAQALAQHDLISIDEAVPNHTRLAMRPAGRMSITGYFRSLMSGS